MAGRVLVQMTEAELENQLGMNAVEVRCVRTQRHHQHKDTHMYACPYMCICIDTVYYDMGDRAEGCGSEFSLQFLAYRLHLVFLIQFYLPFLNLIQGP